MLYQQADSSRACRKIDLGAVHVREWLHEDTPVVLVLSHIKAQSLD